MKFIENTCSIRTFVLYLEVYSMFPYENSVSLCLLTTCSFKRFISGNSDNSVETVIIIGNTCILWQDHVLKVFSG